MGIAETAGFAALGTDPAADRADEGAVAGHPDDSVVAAPVAVRDPDVAVRGDRHTGRAIEVRVVVAVHARLAEAHDHLALAGKLEDLVPHAHGLAQCAPRVTVRAALRDPQEAVVVEGEAVREGEEPRAEAVDQVAFQVELEDRVEVGARALVRAAAVEDPEVLAVPIGNHSADDAEGAAFGQRLPSERGAVRVGEGLSGECVGRGQAREAHRARDGQQEPTCNRLFAAAYMCIAA